MTQITELQSRITRALERISSGVEGLGAAPASDNEALTESEAARAALEAEAETLRQSLAQARQEAQENSEKLAEALAARSAAEAALREASVRAEDATSALEQALAGAEGSADRDEGLVVPSTEAPSTEAEGTGATSAVNADELANLRSELEDERIANAQLQERVKVLRGRLAEAEAAAPQATPDLAALAEELQRLREANETLSRSNEALREANAKGVGEPHLINKAMLGELESIRAARAVEAAETRTVLAALEPLLTEAAEQGEEEAGA